nr:hypothetical protein CFP56_01237 [Quercus suber]
MKACNQTEGGRTDRCTRRKRAGVLWGTSFECLDHRYTIRTRQFSSGSTRRNLSGGDQRPLTHSPGTLSCIEQTKDTAAGRLGGRWMDGFVDEG